MKRHSFIEIRAGQGRPVDMASLRPSGDGAALEATPLPSLLYGRALRPLCCASGMIIASRGSDIYAFCRDNPETNPTLIAALPPGSEVYCAIAGGDKAIVMTSDGPRHVVVTGGEAVCLGQMPGLPSVDISLREEAVITESVSGITLSEPEAIRDGMLAGADASALTSALTEAWGRL
ncbi:MAG: hypothetical protein NC342_02200, partial [Pseudoflavonifractor sp.]|nr:hypothetical protein [Pseudoflavonifractor sp.]